MLKYKIGDRVWLRVREPVAEKVYNYNTLCWNDAKYKADIYPKRELFLIVGANTNKSCHDPYIILLEDAHLYWSGEIATNLIKKIPNRSGLFWKANVKYI